MCKMSEDGEAALGLPCFLTLDFVTVKYFDVYVALRHFIILYIFVRQSLFLL